MPRAGDGTPSCVCTLRASDALRDARTAEAAAAEDFDPLRIRPYVELGVRGAGGEPSDAEGGGVGGGGGGGGDEDASARTMRLGRVPAEDTVALFRVGHGMPGAGAGAGAGVGVGAGVGAGVGGPDGDRLAASDEEPRRRGRRAALLAAAGVVVAVVAAGSVSGLFSYDAPARGGALPDEVRASVPDPSTTSGSASASASAPRSSRSAVAVAPSSTGPSPSASASTASASPSSSASPSRSAGPSQSPESPAATGSAAPGQGTSPSNGQLSATLRRGDRGPEVTELQLRLRQLFLYNSKADGSYSRQVEDAVRRYQWARGITSDEQGVYGRATRASLESETREP